MFAAPAAAVPIAVGQASCEAGITRLVPNADKKSTGFLPESGVVNCLHTWAASEASTTLDLVRGPIDSVLAGPDKIWFITSGVKAIADGRVEGDEPRWGYSLSAATIYTFMDITDLRTPPRKVTDFPIRVHAVASTKVRLTLDEHSMNGYVRASGHVFLYQTDATDKLLEINAFSAQSRTGFVGDQRLTLTKSVRFLRESGPLTIFELAKCEGFLERNDTLYCEARADPAFIFDQEEFDAMSAANGLPSFRLEDYFALEFSPNLVEAPAVVPEPPGLVLAALGTLGLLGRHMQLRLKWTRSLVTKPGGCHPRIHRLSRDPARLSPGSSALPIHPPDHAVQYGEQRDRGSSERECILPEPCEGVPSELRTQIGEREISWHAGRRYHCQERERLYSQRAGANDEDFDG
jgi:hypothetical protein